jgi:hypothetical protein
LRKKVEDPEKKIILFDRCTLLTSGNEKNRESRVTGKAAKVAKVVINPVSKIVPIESPSIPILQ